MSHSHLIIFDLDDTLVDTSEVFHQARSRFSRLMGTRGVAEDQAVDVFEEIDGLNFAHYGILPQRYAASMKSACEQLLGLPNLKLDPELAAEVQSCAEIVINTHPLPIDGAVELLAWAHSRFELALLTRGTEQLQAAKITSAGFRRYFQTIRIVDKKDAAEFAAVMSKLSYDPRNCWVVGDSIKSDINPGLAAGATCIWYEHKHPYYHWQQEHTDSAAGQHYHAANLAEVKHLLEKAH